MGRLQLVFFRRLSLAAIVKPAIVTLSLTRFVQGTASLSFPLGLPPR